MTLTRAIDDYTGLFKNTQNGDLVRVLSSHMEIGKETVIKYEYLDSGNQYDLDETSFNKYFKKENGAEYISFSDEGVIIRSKNIKITSPTKKNVNSDILKLIEAGYEFKSFFGDTLDGRSISFDLNEED